MKKYLFIFQIFIAFVATAQIVTCPSDKIKALDNTCKVLINATDNVSPTIFDTLNCSLVYHATGATTVSGSGTFAGSTVNLGRTFVNYSLLKNGIVQSQCSFIIDAFDLTKPILTKANNDPTIFDGCAEGSTLNPTVEDNCDITIQSVLKKETQTVLSDCKVKAKQIKYIKKIDKDFDATDNNGNVGTIRLTYYLRDSISPVALGKDLTKQIANVNYSFNASEIDNGSYDNCSLVTFKGCIGPNCTNYLSSIVVSKSMLPLGQNSITYPLRLQVADGCNNIKVVEKTITLNR